MPEGNFRANRRDRPGDSHVGSDFDRSLVIVSHRGPVQFEATDNGRVMTRGSGGLVTALSGLRIHLRGGVWVCGAITEEDSAVAAEHEGEAFTVGEAADTHRIRMVAMPPEEQHRFYAIVANPMLWFIQHYLWDLSNAPDITQNEIDAFHLGYLPVNRRFADAVVAEVEARRGDAVVMLHDYHLYLVGAEVRKRCPDAVLQHFIHIPWPQPDAWRVLPASLREPLLHGLLACDIVAFHTEQFARNFVLTCQELLDLPTSMDELTVTVGDRIVAARWYPISIDAEALEAQATTPEVEAHLRSLERVKREHMILRVDRTDLSKNILRGFKAFDLMLDRHPELRGRVVFVALLQPSRQDVPEYVEYLDRIRRLVADINLKHGSTEWQPISLELGDDLPRALAAYRLFDVLVVNSVFDGMNLVAKEGMLLNRRDGVLVLSEHAGVHEELGAFALAVHPFDLEELAERLHQAITMNASERRDRREACVAVVRENNLAKWLRAQFEDLAALTTTPPVQVDLRDGVRPAV